MLWYVPARHRLQTDDPDLEVNVPMSQSIQLSDDKNPSPVWNVPALHRLHADVPVPDW
jgi:hypothetical protein